MIEEIEEFVKKRPQVVAAYGYGSGVFKQSGYSSKDKPQIDLILIVDDLRKWHEENMKLNKKDYSMMGRHFFKTADIEKLKGKTGITYVSNIKENGSVYKYGTIEEADFKKYLKTWKSFYLPGRFQKNVYPIIETPEIKKLIDENREQAFLLSTYLQKEKIVTKKDILVTLCGLSYLGDTRMKFAENPRKVLNIVEGSFNEFDKIYKLNKKYTEELANGTIEIKHDKIKEDIENLPKSLVDYLGMDTILNDDIIKNKILEYFENLNKVESSTQTIKGIYTNGICRSIKYASKKVLKKIKK